MSTKVIMIDDGNHELDETFFLQLKDPRSSSIYPAVLGDNQEVKITITNEEDVPTITFSKNEVSVREPEPAKTRDVTVHVKRMGDTNGNSRVRVSTRDGSAISGVDYEPKSEMLRFLPNSNDVVFTVTVKCNEKSAWHKTFSLVMGPDEPVNAVLGQFSSMTVTILDKEAAGSLVLPSPPSVVSLEDLNKVKRAAKEPKTGYPIVCVTPCDKEYPGYSDMESLCNEAGINNEHVRYSWEIALPDSSNFERLSDVTPWTNPKSKVLDSVYFKPKCRVRCVAQAYSPEGKGGTPLRSVPVTISAEGYCHNPLVGGSRAFQAQNFHTELEYLDNEDKDHPNSVRIKVEVPHEDGLLPIISTSKIYNIDFLLRNEVFRQQHVCSNLLTPSQAPQTQAGRGFMDGYDAARIPQIPGFDLPHQFDDELRSPQSLSLYQYLNLKSCTWTFETFYTMTELAQTCGGEISKDFEYAKRGQSHVTVKVPFYVSYIYVQAPTGWASLQHQSQLEISFSYSNVMWRTGIQTDSEFTGEVVIERVSIDTYGRLVVEFKSTAHFRGLFVDKHHSVADTKASFEPPLNVQTNFTLELVWSEETYDSPVQHWKATSKFSRKDYTGEYDLNLIPCSVQPTQGYESPAEVPPEEGALMPGQPANRKPDKTEKKDPPCSAQEPKIFLTEPKEQNIEEIDYKGTFAKGSRIYARVLWEPKQDLKDAYKLQLEKVYLCTGSNGFVPTFDPSGEIYGQGPQYGCIRPMKSISHRFLILDRGNRDAEDEDFQDIKFEAEFASDNPEYYTLHKISSCDGFSFNVDPLYKIVAGHEWYLQVLYVIGSADGRMRRHAEMVTVSDYVERKRRAVAGGDEYLQTLFSSHSAQNGTNMHGLQLVQPEEGIVGIIIGTVSTCLIMILVIFFVYRRRQDSKSADDEDRLTAEEEALIAKKLGSMSHSQYGQGGHVPKVNNVPSVYTGSTNKKLNNQNYHQPANRRNDIMIRNHITPPNVKIHNNLRSKRDGTEI